jgi:transposase-like protein
MEKIDYDGYRFPPAIIQQAIWLYFRFTLSFRDVDLRGLAGGGRSPTKPVSDIRIPC